MTDIQTGETDAASLILRADAEGVATLTLNRPKTYNALSTELMSAMQAEIDTIAEDESVRAVVVEGAGNGFCAGHDMKQLRANNSREYYERTFKQSSKLMLSLIELPQPVIAKVHGIATAAGCQLVATCDLAVASHSARFATPGVHIGLFCSTPMVALSRNVARKQAMEMLLTGDMIDAETAKAYGLINEAVADEALDDAVRALTGKVTSKSAHVVKIGKAAFYRQKELGVEEAYAYTAGVMAENMMAKDAQEGIGAFLEKRKPEWQDA